MPQPAVVKLVGRIDISTSAAVESQRAAALDSKPAAVMFDLAGVTFVSSIGLRVLLMAAKRCRQENISLVLHSIAPQVMELFKISGLNSFLSIHDTAEAALASLNQA
jgi:anti-anti-sigma factor